MLLYNLPSDNASSDSSLRHELSEIAFQRPQIISHIENNESGFVLKQETNYSDRDTYTVKQSVEPVQWTIKLEKKFQSLVEAKAFGNATEAQLVELENLMKSRRVLRNPVDIDTLIQREQIRKMECTLIQQLEQYVSFIATKNS